MDDGVPKAEVDVGAAEDVEPKGEFDVDTVDAVPPKGEEAPNTEDEVVVVFAPPNTDAELAGLEANGEEELAPNTDVAEDEVDVVVAVALPNTDAELAGFDPKGEPDFEELAPKTEVAAGA